MWRRGSRSSKRSRHCLQLLFSSKILLFSLIWFAVVCIITRSVTRILFFLLLVPVSVYFWASRVLDGEGVRAREKWRRIS